MNSLKKNLILGEVVICFGPAFILLAMGMAIIPTALRSLFSGHFYGLYILGMLVGGVLGITGLIALTIKILEPESNTLAPSKVKLFISLGILAVLGFLVMASEGGPAWQLAVVSLPIIASIHLLYLGRSYVFYNGC